MKPSDSPEFSPALLTALRRKFKSEEIEDLSKIFAWCVHQSGNTERGVEREANVSFNPRMARIVQILLDLSESSALEVAAAFLACTPKAFRELEALPSTLKDAASIATAVKEALQTGNFIAESTEKIGISILIDTVRHLHMSKDMQYRSEEIASAQKILSGLSQTKDSKYHLMLSKAIDHQSALLLHQ